MIPVPLSAADGWKLTVDGLMSALSSAAGRATS